ncbi:MAG: UDP-N-acetylmuramoyl-L-alanyl-D-glutamate--2,6-diaminopimelate ligase [Clostridia bacterium]|nr:UDP-N-acetylmuramoyl-L-alanyl-D-glutamate--2,6-diaminopimelate ligase [Clostridia bacterium]
MRLEELLKEEKHGVSGSASDREISDITFDSRKAGSSSLFFCLRGAKADGHAFAGSAYDSGCRAFVCDHVLGLPPDAVQILVADTRRSLSSVAAAFYGRPSEKLKVIGITGTKGKTSTAAYICGILNGSGRKCGYIGTLGVWIGDKRYVTKNSTPESCDIQRYLAEMDDDGFGYAVMEVSSQALVTHRVDDVNFHTVMFTNLSPDHISPVEHATFEDYRDAKKKLFSSFCSERMIFNADDPASGYMTEGYSGELIPVTLKGSRSGYSASGILPFRDDSSLGVEFKLTGNGLTETVRIKSPGEFSAYNGMSAIAACVGCGVPFREAVRLIGNISVPGRFEIAASLAGALFIVDYAHNGTSLAHALGALRAYSPKRLVCLFGCIGGRAFTRRGDMARISDEMADMTVITSDNPDSESPEEIIKDVEDRYPRKKPYLVITDRETAVRAAVGLAEKGDIILFAGKGHEDYQLVMGEKIPFSEKKIILDEISKLSK